MSYKRPYKNNRSVQLYLFCNTIFRVGMRIKYKAYNKYWVKADIIAIVPGDYFELKILPDENKRTRKKPWNAGYVSKIKAKNAIII